MRAIAKCKKCGGFLERDLYGDITCIQCADQPFVKKLKKNLPQPKNDTKFHFKKASDIDMLDYELE